MTGEPQLRATCRQVFVFEVGWAIDLDAAERILGGAGARQILRPRGTTPAAFQHGPAPIRITAPVEGIPLGGLVTEPTGDIVL